MSVLEGARQVGMARPQPGHDLRLEALFRRGHLRGPVHVVLVLQDERHRAPDRESAAHTADDPRDVRLDLLPPAAAVAALPAREVAAKILLADLEEIGRASCRER